MDFMLGFEETHAIPQPLAQKQEIFMECGKVSPFFELPDGICEACTVLEWIFHHTYMAGTPAVLAVRESQVASSRHRYPGDCVSGVPLSC